MTTEEIIKKTGRALWAGAQGKPIAWFEQMVRQAIDDALQAERLHHDAAATALHEGVVKARRALEGKL